VGIAFGVLGAALALRSALLLAGRGRPRRAAQPAFVLAGPYLRIRNPLLAGLLLMLASAAVGTASWRIALAAASACLAAHLWVVLIEERRLQARFGVAYAEYLRRVPRWLPRLGRRPPAAL
jgi:protein-S-isoprenylcysteine O-methyltransferase Ste14